MNAADAPIRIIYNNQELVVSKEPTGYIAQLIPSDGDPNAETHTSLSDALQFPSGLPIPPNPLLEQVKALFKGKEPGQGGYGGEFDITEVDDGIMVTLIAEYYPRYLSPVLVVTKIEGTNITFYGTGADESYLDRMRDKPKTETLDEFESTIDEMGYGSW